VSSRSPRLVVDDIGDNRIIFSRRLVRRGFEVVEGDGGRAALELIAQQPPDRAFGRR
jgi:CheY-like chemotaxis protein